jgi:hypothetical protein
MVEFLVPPYQKSIGKHFDRLQHNETEQTTLVDFNCFGTRDLWSVPRESFLLIRYLPQKRILLVEYCCLPSKRIIQQEFSVAPWSSDG